MQSDDLGLVERLASAGIVPAGWFLPWNEYHGYQQVAEQHNAEPDLVPLFGLDALIYLDGETQALLSGERAVLPQTKQHAEALYTVAVACLKSYGVDVEAELAAKDAAIERLVAERDEARRRATDEQYMKQAYWYMLGPIGLKVAQMWFDKRVKRVHHSWGPDAASLTGEERAQCILDFEASARRVVPADSIDGPDARQSLRDAP